jgi:beta-N-acetylhexosaminidase
MDDKAQAGQLLMVGVSATEPPGAATALVRELRLGGVFLAGRDRRGVEPVAERTKRLHDASADSRVRLLVSADQEGGQVQALSGPGFSDIPSAEVQATWPPAALTKAANRWGQELHRAGVNLDLAPVADVVSPTLGKRNLAVGANQRSFGTNPATVSPQVLAFIDGLRSARVATSVKHFPGLGRVAPNTDFSSDVRDDTSTGQSPWLQPFSQAVKHGVPVVMVSSAVYTRIDDTSPAAFSAPVVDQLLRKTLGFTGVVISDDLGNAAAVATVSRADRAVRFIAAGGDIALTVEPKTARPMLGGVADRITQDPRFADQVRAAALRVMALKESLGLLSCD